MPTYEYVCKKCTNQFELVQSIKDNPIEKCPSCGGQVRKVFSPIGIAFKGSGFYKNDSRTSSNGSAKSDTTTSSQSSAEPSSASTSTQGDSGSTADKTSEWRTSESKASEPKKDTSSPAKPSAPKPAPAATPASVK